MSPPRRYHRLRPRERKFDQVGRPRLIQRYRRLAGQAHQLSGESGGIARASGVARVIDFIQGGFGEVHVRLLKPRESRKLRSITWLSSSIAMIAKGFILTKDNYRIGARILRDK
jgi:hypothetical protein